MNGSRSKQCLKKEETDYYISSKDTICLNDFKSINELRDLNNHLNAQFCGRDLFFTQEIFDL